MLKDHAEEILSWYEKNARDLPWRHTGDPYRIWISEIMLQQTRAVTVIPYYHRFLSECPDVFALADLPEDRLLKLWEGLGYYNRARNLKKCAEILVRDFHGVFPRDFDKLKSLPGFGPYTAAAVSAFAFGIPVIPADGNVFRVFCRFYGVEEDLRKDQTKNRIRRLASENAVCPAGEYGQALIELGATLCVPGTPDCASCPLKSGCAAFQKGIASNLPFLSGIKPRRIEHRTVLILRSGSHVLIRKRPEKGLLAGLYEFPSLTGENITTEEIISFAKKLDLEALHIKSLSFSKHIFTHIEWHMDAFLVQVAETEAFTAPPYIFANREDIQTRYAIPAAFSPWIDEIL